MAMVAIIGLGNIGSAAAALVARIPQVSTIILVDYDKYDESNLLTQAIDRSALGKPKVEVQAALIHAIRPEMEVIAFAERIENVPLASFANSILLSCVDNRAARQTINRIAWRCGIAWIDAAVDQDSLVRTNAYKPGQSQPCLECAWDQVIYDLIAERYPCNAAGAEPVPATGAGAELGTLAASLQVGELRKMLVDAANGESLIGAQLMLDITSYAKHLTRFTHNDQCRFDHRTLAIEISPLTLQDATLADLFDEIDAGTEAVVRLDGHKFAMFVDCVLCQERKSVGLAIFGRLGIDDRTCRCGGKMFAPGFFSFEALHRSDLSSTDLRLKLGALGFRPGDVISLGGDSGSMRHIELRAGALG